MEFLPKSIKSRQVGANEDCLLGHKPDSKSRQLHLADLKPSGTAMRVLKTASRTGFILENHPDAMWHFHRVLNVYPDKPDEQSTPVSRMVQGGHVNRQVKRTASLCWLLTAGWYSMAVPRHIRHSQCQRTACVDLVVLRILWLATDMHTIWQEQSEFIGVSMADEKCSGKCGASVGIFHSLDAARALDRILSYERSDCLCVQLHVDQEVVGSDRICKFLSCLCLILC